MKNSSASSGETHAYHHGDLRRALIDAAMAMVQEEQDWTFSLREVARRAGVSHNAPYNHFAGKRDLIASVAAAGFAALREQLLASVAGVRKAEVALVKSAVAYVKFGVENPAHYRLMFGSATAVTGNGQPDALKDAAEKAKMVLNEIIYPGAPAGDFAVSLASRMEMEIAVLSAWSAVNGLTMLAIDGQVASEPFNVEKVAEKMACTFCYGLLRR
jgi:AcrR family transcriptional regulator